VTRRRDRGVCVFQTSDVELDRQQIVVVADRRRNLGGIATGGERVASGQRSGNIESQPRPAPVISQTFLSVWEVPFSGVVLPAPMRISMSPVSATPDRSSMNGSVKYRALNVGFIP
jgi:hypothetical protein